MNTKRILPAALAALLTTGAAGGIAYSRDGDRNQDTRDATALAGMKVSLSQAIATAE